jgi:hypothetical protein
MKEDSDSVREAGVCVVLMGEWVTRNGATAEIDDKPGGLIRVNAFRWRVHAFVERNHAWPEPNGVAPGGQRVRRFPHDCCGK